MAEYRVITPVDVLFLRGNRLFGGAGEHGESQVPPWPSVFAGAMASRILSDKGKIGEIAKKPDKAQPILNEVAGEKYGCVFLALTLQNKTYLPLPGDLVALESDGGEVLLFSLSPTSVPDGLKASNPLPMIPVLRANERKKPISGLWLDLEGWKEHLKGNLPQSSSLARQSELWKVDSRLGIARDYHTKTAEEGRIYTTEGIALEKGCAFLVGYEGNDIPKDGLLRLGGDGRGAVIEPCDGMDTPKNVGKPGDGWPGFRMILITPGIFPEGWLPPGCSRENGKILLNFNGLEAELMAVAMGRYEVVSGWDLAKHEPKPARKVVPAGSVYWFKVLEGDTSELIPLWENSLYSAVSGELDSEWMVRRREGFGRVWFGVWNVKGEV